MTPETLQYYAPCPIHKLWHDTTKECFYCVVANAEVAAE